MKGGFFHEKILIGRIESALRSNGARVYRELRVVAGRHSRSADVVADWEGYRIVCEPETTTQRVPNDPPKALDLQADLLLIPVANRRMARAAERRLRKHLPRETLGRLKIFILPLGAALRLVSNKSLLMSALNVRQTTIQDPPLLATKEPPARSQITTTP